MTNFEVKKRTSELEGFGLGDCLRIEKINSTLDELYMFSLVNDKDRMAGFISVDGKTYLGGGETMAQFELGDIRAIELFIEDLKNSDSDIIVTPLSKNRYKIMLTLEEI